MKMLTVLLLLLQGAAHAQIITTESIHEVLNLPPAELMVFDVDDTLIDESGSLMEPVFAAWIQSVQSQGSFTLAATSRSASLGAHTAAELRAIGVNLAARSVYDSDFRFRAACIAENPASRYVPSDGAATFTNGILSLGEGNCKGLELFHFLDLTGRRPKSLMMIDDQRVNLEAVREHAAKRGVEFTGVHYTRALSRRAGMRIGFPSADCSSRLFPRHPVPAAAAE